MDWGLAVGVVGVVAIPAAIGIGMTMASPSPSEQVFAKVCFIAAGVMTAASFVWVTYEQSLSKTKLISAAVVGAIALAGIVAGMDWVKKRSALQSRPNPPLKLDRTLKVSCNSYARRPATGFEDRRLYTVQLADPTNGFAGMNYATGYFGAGIGTIQWGDDYPEILGRCSITNFGATNLFRVSFVLETEYIEAIKTETGISQGRSVKRFQVISPEFDLVPSLRTEDVFYIVNLTQYIVHMRVSKTASVYTADSDTPMEVNLLPTDGTDSFVYFMPREPKHNPPVSTLPTPAPSSTPASK